jgi:hypothetical protein
MMRRGLSRFMAGTVLLAMRAQLHEVLPANEVIAVRHRRSGWSSAHLEETLGSIFLFILLRRHGRCCGGRIATL